MHLDKSLLDCVSSDKTRYSLSEVFVDVDEKLAIATNGHLLVMVPIDPAEGEVSGYVPKDAILEAAKQKGSFKGLLIHQQTHTIANGISYPNPFSDADKPVTFPVDWKRLIPAYANEPCLVGFNASYLGDIAAVISDPKNPAVGLTLDLTKSVEAVIVVSGLRTPSTFPGDERDWSRAKALLMPVRDDAMRLHTCGSESEELRTRARTAEQLVAEQSTTIQRLIDENAVLTAALATAQEAPPSLAATIEARLQEIQQQYAALTAQYETLVSAHADLDQEYTQTVQELIALSQRLTLQEEAADVA